MQPPDSPDSMDLERPSVARMYDYFLGGSHNFAVDREAARQIIAAAPEAPVAAQANRAFLRRATRFLVDLGVRQFLDIGSGIPTVGNVHEIAQQLAPQTRVMYVDIDPVAVAHSRQILDGNDLAGVIQEDLRQPDRVLDNPDLRKLIDLGEPVAVMLVAVLHFVPDAANPAGVIAALRRELPPGSYLVLSHASAEGREDQVDSIKSVYERQRVDNSVHPRSRAEVTQMFDGFELVPPGVVWVSEWRPEDPREVTGGYNAGFLCGVGRLRG